jgi:hypothetical protein
MTKNPNVFQIVGMDQMEQRSVVFSLSLNGLSKKAIHHEFVAVLQENAFSESNVTIFCEEVVECVNSEEASSSPKDDGLDETNEAILLALSDEPFASVRQISRRICLIKSTRYRRFADSLHFTVKHLHSVLDKLSDS